MKLPCSGEEKLEEGKAIFFSVSYDQLETTFKMITVDKRIFFLKKEGFPLCVRFRKFRVFVVSYLTGKPSVDCEGSIIGNRPTERAVS
jgi:hypothetical protein